MVPKNLNVVVVNASRTAGNVMDKTTVVIIQMRASVDQVHLNFINLYIKIKILFNIDSYVLLL